MRQTISLGVEDLAVTRFAVSPLAETVFALQLVRTGAADTIPWAMNDGSSAHGLAAIFELKDGRGSYSIVKEGVVASR